MKKQTKKTATTKTATSKKAAAVKNTFKIDPKRLKRMQEVIDGMEDEDSEDGVGKIACILKLYTKGFSRKEIVAFGFNRSTTYRQTRELDKYKKAPALQYFGHDLFERRVQRLMQSKGISRDKAVSTLMDKDLEG